MGERGSAVVTGAGQGLGRAIATRLAADGFDIVALDVNAEPLASVAAEHGWRSAVVDVSDPAQTAAVADLAPDCTVLVNNAAIQRYRDLMTTTPQDMREILEINVMGPVLMAQALVPVIEANGGGSIVNLSSITSQSHAASTSLYPTSKAAINLLTEAMAVEFGARGIRVNAVGPGTVLTEGTSGHYGNEEARAAIARVLPIGRMGEPDDIANAVSFLCSSDASWVTGQVLFVDGGFSASQGQFFRLARKAPQ
ncbi:MAG: SDR family oxidoreductase [Actinomycetales bacterium]|nr:SDR family oxidoreductase [Actinomycetales bacterium]